MPGSPNNPSAQQAPSQQQVSHELRRAFVQAGQQLLNKLADQLFGEIRQESTPPVLAEMPSLAVAEHSQVLPEAPALNSSDSPLSAGAQSEPCFDTIWPDGECQFEVPEDQMDGNTPFFGWAFVMTQSFVVRAPQVRRRLFHCLGVFKCPNCDFVARPKKPRKPVKGTPPLRPKKVCVAHPDEALEWVPCGGNSESFCKLQVGIALNGGPVIATHMGAHNHLKPPPKQTISQSPFHSQESC